MPNPTPELTEHAAVAAEARAALVRLRELAAELVAVLYDQQASDEERTEAGRLLIELGPSAAPALVEFLCADPKRARDDAAAIICEIGEAAVEPLLASLPHGDPDVRATVAFLFTSLRDGEGRSEEALLALLDDPDELVRQSAAYALGAQDCRRAVPKLIALATRPIQMPRREADPEAWAEAYPYDCCAAVDALGQIGDPRAVQPLIFLVESQGVDGPMYDEAVRALGLLGDFRGEQVVRQAFEHNRHDGLFADALAALHGREALDELLDGSESPDPEIRRAVCQELIRLGSPAAAEAVARLLVDHDDTVRDAARAALSWTVERQTADEVIAGLEDPSPDVRAWTVSLLPLACAWSD